MKVKVHSKQQTLINIFQLLTLKMQTFSIKALYIKSCGFLRRLVSDEDKSFNPSDGDTKSCIYLVSILQQKHVTKLARRPPILRR